MDEAERPALTRPPQPSRAATDHEQRQWDEQFSTFYRHSIGRLVNFLVWLGASPNDAPDLAQDTMIKAHRRWPDINNPDAWIRRVASRDWGHHVHGIRETPTDPLPEHTVLVGRISDLERLEQRHDVLRLLATLPPRQRQVLAWDMDGYSAPEIAHELGITPTAVRSSLRKARQALRAQSEREGRDQ
jgi:RNA polymerase sigma-70 factor (ECF subfamily)